MYLSPWKFFQNQILLDYLGRWRNQSCQIFFQSVHSGVSGKGSKFAIFSANRRWPLQLLYYRTTVMRFQFSKLVWRKIIMTSRLFVSTDLHIQFAQFDKDGDGLITSHELTQVMTSLRLDVKSDEIKKILQKIDLSRKHCWISTCIYFVASILWFLSM